MKAEMVKDVHIRLYTQKDFLYERKGPWPQPSPDHPLGEAPAVLHLPKQEKRDWNSHIGSRYFFTLLTYWPVALRYALKNRTLPAVDDTEFSRLMTTSIYSRLLCPTLDPADRAAFAEFLADADDDTVFYKIDLTPIASVEPYEGMYVAPTVTLVRQDGPDADKRVVAIKINDLVLASSDVNAWNLAKYFVLQGAAYGILFTEHPNTHFP
ncbi:hypothetical protein JYT28_01220, partial [Desulfobulbus sp. AH-315-M07]|nr:hypothetical protein [Desulfobulbus sp. AH-315-M07]